MDLNEAHTLALRLMTQHKLIERGWRFKFDRAERRLGLCNYSTKTISISWKMASAADEHGVQQTVLHEIAHALLPATSSTGERIGHGPAWRRLAKDIGYEGKRTSVNPHREQMRPAHETSPDKELPAGTVVLLSNGRRGRIVKIGRSRYHVKTDDGSIWTSPFNSVRVL